MHRQLARTLRSARKKRQEHVGKEFAHLTNDQWERIFRDHAIMLGRRQRQYAASLRGPERAKRLHDILKVAMLQLPKRGSRGEAFWRADRLLHRKACRHLAAHLPPEARRVFKRKQVRPRMVARYTQDMAFYFRHDLDREMAAYSGLLKLVS
jgi:hypothetical protein